MLIISGSEGFHEFDNPFPGRGRSLPVLPGHRATGVGPEPDPVGEEDFFKGPGLIGLVGGGCELLPGIPGFGIPNPEGEGMTIPVDQFVGLGGFGGGVKAAELEFLNLLHVETELDYTSNIESNAPIFNSNFKLF